MSEAAQLKAFAALGELGEEDREVLAELCETVEVRAGRRLFRFGGEADGMAMLVDGTVELSSPRTDEIASLGPGAVFGSASLVAVVKHEATARAATSCTLLFLERSRFRRLADDYPRTACRLLEALLSEFASQARATLDELVPAQQ